MIKEVLFVNIYNKNLAVHFVKKGTYADCADSDIIVITAGVARKVGESRNDLLMKNSKIMESICSEIRQSGTNAIVIVVSNPVDVLANHVAKFLQMPKGVEEFAKELLEKKLVTVIPCTAFGAPEYIH